MFTSTLEVLCICMHYGMGIYRESGWKPTLPHHISYNSHTLLKNQHIYRHMKFESYRCLCDTTLSTAIAVLLCHTRVSFFYILIYCLVHYNISGKTIQTFKNHTFSCSFAMTKGFDKSPMFTTFNSRLELLSLTYHKELSWSCLGCPNNLTIANL